MIARLFGILPVLFIIMQIAKANNFYPNVTENINTISNASFKEYIDKFRPSTVWRDIEEKNKIICLRKTLKDEFETIFKRIDGSEELLNLKVKNGEPKILLQKDGRRWKPPGDVQWNSDIDPFSVRPRLLELMKQAIYQTRTKMVTMQVIREKYNKISVYKMGFLISKTDRACKTFAGFASKAFRACAISRQGAVKVHPNLHIMESHERLLDLWFDVDLLVDLVTLNHENCKRMLNQVLTNRKYAWKFVD